MLLEHGHCPTTYSEASLEECDRKVEPWTGAPIALARTRLSLSSSDLPRRPSWSSVTVSTKASQARHERPDGLPRSFPSSFRRRLNPGLQAGVAGVVVNRHGVLRQEGRDGSLGAALLVRCIQMVDSHA